MSHSQFFEKLTTSGIFPTTSQINPYTYEEKFREEVEKGNTVLCICLSSKLSGCYKSAMIAKEEFGDKVYVVDSLSVTLGEQLIIRHALDLIKEGKSAAGIVNILDKSRDNSNFYLVSRNGKKYFVNVTKEFVTTVELNLNIDSKSFVLGEHKYLIGMNLL